MSQQVHIARPVLVRDLPRPGGAAGRPPRRQGKARVIDAEVIQVTQRPLGEASASRPESASAPRTSGTRIFVISDRVIYQRDGRECRLGHRVTGLIVDIVI